VTLPESFIVLIVIYFAMAVVPKIFRPKKKRKPIPKRGRLKLGALWKRNRPPSQATIDFALRCQAENIEKTRNAQPVLALEAALRELGLTYQRETIWFLGGDKFVISDFAIAKINWVIEQDGLQHRYQHAYDRDKDKIILERFGHRTLRRWNAWFLGPCLAERLKAELGL
jgi:very-short-patch-repair endonuclease